MRLTRLIGIGWGLLLLFSACSPDILVPCENNGLKTGLLCRQYIYQDKTVTGYYDYYYNSKNQLIKKALSTSIGTVIKEESYGYNTSNLVNTETRTDKENNTDTTFQYSYNSFDSLGEKYIYVSNNLVSHATYTYDSNNKRYARINFVGDSVHSFVYYTYLSDGRTYKITSYAADTSVTAYTLYNYYDNGLLKIEYYDSTSLINYDLIEYETDTLIKLSKFDGNQNLTGYYSYKYDGYGNIDKILFYNEDDELLSYYEFKYYY